MSTLEQATKFKQAKDYQNAEKLFIEIFEKNEQQLKQNDYKLFNRSKILQEQEQCILELGELYAETKQNNKLSNLIKNGRIFMMAYAKSKISKVLKSLIEYYDKIPDSIDDQISICKDCIEFAVQEKRVFLKHTLSIRLATLYYNKQQFKHSLELINGLLSEFKKLDDKSSLVDVHLLESKVYHKLRNMPKAKAALTSARTAANSIYCPSLTIAELDLISGILHCEDKDYKTAFSYFYEAFDTFHESKTSYQKSCQVLKYMLLCKIMLNLLDDINSILDAKYTKDTYQSRDIDAMKAVAEAYSNRSLLDFNKAMKMYEPVLKSDPLIRSHLNALYDALLESNLCKIIEPFDCVEIFHISNLIGLDIVQVEGKLSQMILDKVFYGVLDQGNGCLHIYQTPQLDATYDSSLELIGNLNRALDQLFDKASLLN
ncbi:proteasome regulatory particle lid subunit RPN6 SCDLUD_002667 [Saccharomycodes ludwigii]|uniref:proteasome regulatory particle lid subunit RPN6 n=1 Tax=Saccharomycodes ludwigii TaxID=36035 RepID=UPI001E83B1B0|nr:hypothetical protein SCDLUD_002667 [Saccharomycodes ludwigii]KAH3901183.1 hypothetical protein SCDLUD_002667 [Saccharomycodes ludwigii]